jgi:hypothetical protein
MVPRFLAARREPSGLASRIAYQIPGGLRRSATMISSKLAGSIGECGDTAFSKGAADGTANECRKDYCQLLRAKLRTGILVDRRIAGHTGRPSVAAPLSCGSE